MGVNKISSIQTYRKCMEAENRKNPKKYFFQIDLNFIYSFTITSKKGGPITTSRKLQNRSGVVALPGAIASTDPIGAWVRPVTEVVGYVPLNRTPPCKAFWCYCLLLFFQYKFSITRRGTRFGTKKDGTLATSPCAPR